jgi:hypothetical protein
MSIRLVQEREYPCSRPDCTAQFKQSTAIAGSYCSEDCAAQDTGRKFLANIRRDHRFCWSCFRTRKEIERPTDELRRGRGRHTAEAIIGYEYPTQHVEMGPYGLECECGGIDHDTPDWDVRYSVPYQWFLYRISEQLVNEGQREDAIDLVTLADELWETDDLELAVGRALRD